MYKIYQYFLTHKKLTLFAAFLWTIIIIIGCSIPGKDIPKIGLFEHFDKVVHFTFFAVFFILWYIYYHTSKQIVFILILISAIFGFLIEWYQLNFVAGRSFDVWDGVADTIGALIGALFIYFLNKKK